MKCVTDLPFELQLLIIEKLIPLLSRHEKRRLFVAMHFSSKHYTLARKHSINFKNYVVISYFNYRKDVSITVLKSFKNFYDADKYALEKAHYAFSNREINTGIEPSRSFVHVTNQITLYTIGDGSDTNVYSVVGTYDNDM